MDLRYLTLIAVLLLLSSTSVSSLDWPMFQRDPQHTGYTPDLGPLAGDLLWSSDVIGRVTSSPAVSGGIIYVSIPESSTMYALNASTGGKIWNFTASNVIKSSPAVYDGLVYVGSNDQHVYALNAYTGEQVWSYETVVGVEDDPIVVDGVLYVGTFVQNYFYALNASTGQQIWNFTDFYGAFTESPAYWSGRVYFGTWGSANSSVCALTASTGSLLWSFTVGGNDSAFSAAPTISDGILYVGSLNSNLYALNASTGGLMWNHTTPGVLQSSPVVHGGVVYFGSNIYPPSARFYALDSVTGQDIWSYNLPDYIDGSPAISSNGVVYLVTPEPMIYAFNASAGDVIWTYTPEGYGSMGSPVISGGGVYVGGTSSGKVYALGESTVSTTISSTTTSSTTSTSTSVTSTTTSTSTTTVVYSTIVNVTANVSQMVNASGTNTSLELTAGADVSNASVTVTSYGSNPSNASFSVPALGKYLDFNVSEELEGNLTAILIKTYYSDAEVTAANLNESTLGFYWLNESIPEWQRLNASSMDWVYGTGVDTTQNFVWANVSHFSQYTIGGESLSQEVDVSLQSGWNLISLPVNL